jgi:hypothetical protein
LTPSEATGAGLGLESGARAPRINPRISMALAIVLAGIAVLVLALSGSGGGGLSPGSALTWDSAPTVIRPSDLPHDRVTYGTIRNESLRPLKISVNDLSVLDGAGKPVRATERFIPSFAHGLYGAFQQPDSMPEPEQLRLGYLASMNPGQTSPLLVSVHLKPSSELPLSVFYRGSAVLSIPKKAVTPG